MRLALFLLAYLLQSATTFGFEPTDFKPCNSTIACSMRSVVSVLPVWPNGAARSEEPEGSGVVLAEGSVIATADHVLGQAKKVFIRTWQGEVVEAQILYRDAPTDIALLTISERLTPMPIAKNAEIGSKACAIGNSFGLDLSITCGIVSATQQTGTGFNEIEDFIQTDAAVNPGMSGGALVNANGEIIGLLSAIFTKTSDANIGVNFAVSADLLTRFTQDILDDGKLERITSKLRLRPATKRFTEGMAGAEIVAIKTPSPEAKAGLKSGDIILFANDRRIKRAGAYKAALALLKKDDRLQLKIMRDGIQMTVSVLF